MNFNQQIAKHFRDVHFGGNWTVSNLHDNIKDVTWREATTKIHSLNTIATLLFHMNYFVNALLDVLQAKPLNSNDKFSFDHPPINSQDDWENLVKKALGDAEHAAKLIEQLPENKLMEKFVDEKYGNYYRNIHGIIEHTHYHLGQLALVKKLLRSPTNTDAIH